MYRDRPVNCLDGLHCRSGEHFITLGGRFAALRDCLIALGARLIARGGLCGSARGFRRHILTRSHRLPQKINFLLVELELEKADLMLMLVRHNPQALFDAEVFAPGRVACEINRKSPRVTASHYRGLTALAFGRARSARVVAQKKGVYSAEARRSRTSNQISSMVAARAQEFEITFETLEASFFHE